MQRIRKVIFTLIVSIFAPISFSTPVDINLVGTWVASSGSWSHTGTRHNPLETKLSNAPLYPQLKILEQSGHAFSGDFTRDDGKGPVVAGVISPNNEDIYMSLDTYSVSGKLGNNSSTLTVCGATNSNMYNRAFCTTYKKQIK